MKTVMAHDFMGAEGASIAEVVHAVTCGFKPSHVVYDSPVKSRVSSIRIIAFNGANNLMTNLSLNFVFAFI